MGVVKEALADINAIKEEAIKVATNRLTKENKTKFDKFLKEEIQKRLNESMIEQQDDSMVADQEDSMKLKADEEMPVSESDVSISECDESADPELSDENEISIDDLKEAMEELEVDDNKEQVVDEHDMSLNIDFNKDGIKITDVTADNKEFDDVDFDIEAGDGNSEEEISLEPESEVEVTSDELDIEVSDEDEDIEVSDEDEDIDLDFENDDELSEEDFDIEGIDIDELDIEDEVEEGLAHTITHQNARQVGSEGNTNYEKEKRLRFAVKENKDLKVKAEKLKKDNSQLVEMNTKYKDSIQKYKDQLFEMVFHNANLSHVNNLFVEHTTTMDEKINIVEKFNNVQTIDESKKLYKELKSTLNESGKSKKTIEESINRQTTVDEEAVVITETTSHVDPSISKMLSMIKRIEGGQ